MKKMYSVALILAFFLLTGSAFAQILKGRVTDASSGAPLPGVAVTVPGTSMGTNSDVNGNYTLRVRPGDYQLRVSYLGYETQTRSFTMGNQDMTLNFSLSAGAQALDNVTIVGSRSSRPRSSIETVAPVDVITARELQASGQIEPSQMMTMVAPSFNSSRQTVADGTDHIDPATLRGLGPDQVLVLLNGKRRHNQALVNVNGTIGRGSVGTDLNTIPVAGIQRIEVLREGAASQYGSDAIAGVVNVVLKSDTGTTATVHVGQTYESDGENAQLGLYHGFKIGNLGVIGAAADIRLRNRTNRVGRYQGPVYRNWNVAQGANESEAAWIARRQGLYDQDQELIRQNNFNLEDNMLVGNSAVNNFGGMLNGTLKVSPMTEVYFSGTLNYRKGDAAGFYRYPFQTSQVIAELYPNGFLPQIHSTIWDRAFLAGIGGQFGQGWRWDLSNVYGGNSFRYDIKNSNNASQFAMGAAAPTEFYAGTLQFNQNTTDLGVSKDFGKNLGVQTFNVAAGVAFRIDNYQIEAGEEASYTNYAPASGRAAGAQVFPGYQPANAVNTNRNVSAAYVDVETDLTDELLLNAAGRYEYYSDFGGNLAGKLSGRYKFADFFAVRSTVSNGFRAPSIHQQNFSAISTVFQSVNGQLEPRQQGTFRNNSAVARAFGIPVLKAEKSMSYSVGITSQVLPNLSLTVDAYQIDIDDRIVLTGNFGRGTSAAGREVTRLLDAAGQREVQSAVFFTNAINTRTQGIDIVLNADYRLGEGTLDLTLAGNFNETQVRGTPKASATLPAELFGNTLFNPEERGRLEWGQPRNKFTLGALYRLNKFGANLRTTRFGEVRTFNPNGLEALDERFTPKVITDLNVSYQVTKLLQFTIGGNNIFDVYPDKIAATQYPTVTNATSLDNSSFGRFVYSRNATQFGFNGGYYFVSASLNF